MNGNLTPLSIDVIEWTTSVTFNQEFNDNVKFNTKESLKIRSVSYRMFPNKEITNYIVWDYILDGFIKYTATDTSFLKECENLINAKELITEIIAESYKKLSNRFNELKRNIRYAGNLPLPKQTMIDNYCSTLIKQLENEDWDNWRSQKV